MLTGLPLFFGYQIQGACVQQRLLEQQEQLVFGRNCAGANPVSVPLPPLVFVGSVWGGGYVGWSFAAVAPRLPLFNAFQLRERAYRSAFVNGRNWLSFLTPTLPVPYRARTLATRRACRLRAGWKGCSRAALAPLPPLDLAFQLEGAWRLRRSDGWVSEHCRPWRRITGPRT